jgi:hypothetical protein
MLASVMLTLGGVAFLVWRSFRVARREAAAGRPFEPDGKLRW